MSQSARLQQQFTAEDSILKTAILEILHRPQSQSVSLKHITRELASRYVRRDVERCLIKLSEEGLTELVYTSGYDVGVRARLSSNGSQPPDAHRARLLTLSAQ